MKSLQLAGSAFLAKLRAFLALRLSYKAVSGSPRRKQHSDAFTPTPAGRNPRPEFGGRLTKNSFERAIELRERLKADVVCNFADAKIRVQQPVARIFQAHTRNVVGKL